MILVIGATGEAIRRPLRMQEVPPEVAKQGVVKYGLPEALVSGFLTMQAGTYEKILGRPALTFAEWAAEHAADFGGPAGKESNDS